MIFRPIELALSIRYQLGFTVGSFMFDDGTYKTLLGLIWDREQAMLYVSLLFMGYQIEMDNGEEDDGDDVY